MSTTMSWPSTLEGFALGLGIASGVRTMFKPDIDNWMRVTLVLWASSYIFSFGACSFFSKHERFAYYALHVVVFLYRNSLLFFFGARLAEGYGLHRYCELPIVVFYSLFHIGWIIASLSNITSACLLGTWSGQCQMSQTHKAFRMGTEISFVLLILILDSTFVYHLARKLCRQHGSNILTFHTNIYHAFAQLALSLVIAANIYRIVRLPYNDDSPTVYPIWQVQDVIVLLLLTEFGCKYNLIIIASRPDTSHEDLESARKLLSQAENTKNNILCYLHHELRNNLQRMIYLSDRLTASGSPSTPKSVTGTNSESNEESTLQSIQTCSAYIASIVEDVLTIENYESGTLALRPRSYNLSELVRTELIYFEQFAEAHGRRILFKNTMPDSYQVMGDSDRVRQVLRILGESCISRSNAETIGDSSAHVEVIATVNGSLTVELKASVSDIFDVTLTEPYTLQSGEGPHDLSQSVVHRILRAVHGHIVLATRQHARIVIPVELDLTTEISTEILPQSRSRLNVLIVDDSKINRTVLRKLMKSILRDKVTIQEAEDGQAATNLVLRESHVFDVIWMDMVMPIKDGIVACREIKAVLPTTVIILVSANDFSGSSDMHGPLAPDDAIVKPVKKSTLEGMLRRHKLI